MTTLSQVWQAFRRERHGDLPGHEFRGNQWTKGQGGGGDSIKADDKSRMKIEAENRSAFKTNIPKPKATEKELKAIPDEVVPVVKDIIEEPIAPPGADENDPNQKALVYAPDVEADENGDGVSDYAVVGVPAMDSPPPPSIPRLPGLNWNERIVESHVCEKVEKDIDGAVAKYNALRLEKSAGNDDPKYFGTDDAKHIFDVWHGSPASVQKYGSSELAALAVPEANRTEEQHALVDRVFQRRAEYNTVLHQAANAVAKRAFLQELDKIAKLPEEQRSVLVTAGGCAAGKGHVLSVKDGKPRVPDVYALGQKAAAVWDSAGDQNGTENPWVAEECAKRGITANFVYVHADGMEAAEKSIARALKVGRQVDGRVLGDSYEQGAKNFQEFAKHYKGGKVYYADNTGDDPTLHDKMPKGKQYTSKEIRKHAEALLTFTSKKITKALDKMPKGAIGRAKTRIVRALTSGHRIFAKG